MSVGVGSGGVSTSGFVVSRGSTDEGVAGSTADPREQPPFRILAVCTGNISRSPAVERLLDAGLGPSVTVTSAGTRAVVGYPMDPPMARLLAEFGGVADGFSARQVTPALLREADLVLTLTTEHRARVVELAPAIVRRTHTLLEFARLAGVVDLSGVPAGSTPGERLRAIVPLAAAARPMVRRPAGASDDVPDPFGRDAEVYALSMALIRSATETIISVAQG